MKQYTKILESINKGIQLALDDFDDESLIVHKSAKITDVDTTGIVRSYVELNQIKSALSEIEDIYGFYYDLLLHKEFDLERLESLGITNLNNGVVLLKYIEELYQNNQKFVDLDLPSKTLWCTNNIGGNASNNYEGDRYKLGTFEKFTGIEWGKNYKIPEKYLNLFNDAHEMLTIHIDLEDDPANHYNEHYRLPSSKQFKELVNNTDLIGLPKSGLFFVSKKNPLNYIFFGPNNILYMTSDIANYNKHNIMNGILMNKFIVYVVKLYQHDEFKYTEMPFKSLYTNEFPPISGYIRPIYIK